MKFYKYQGAGNDFIMIDNINNKIDLNKEQINFLCNRHFGIGADGLILIQKHENTDFYMQYFNSDGNESTMCGNGGRCAVKFAFDLNIITNETTFFAIDGIHKAEVLGKNINLKMIPVTEIIKNQDDFILNTGSPHYVKWIENIKDYQVFNEGKKIRYSDLFINKGGINVNFVEQIAENHLYVRTYERGVENETLACGTGITASVISFAEKNNIKNAKINVESLGGKLSVSFNKENNIYDDIWLNGPAKFVFEGNINDFDY